MALLCPNDFRTEVFVFAFYYIYSSSSLFFVSAVLSSLALLLLLLIGKFRKGTLIWFFIADAKKYNGKDLYCRCKRKYKKDMNNVYEILILGKEKQVK